VRARADTIPQAIDTLATWGLARTLGSSLSFDLHCRAGPMFLSVGQLHRRGNNTRTLRQEYVSTHEQVNLYEQAAAVSVSYRCAGHHWGVGAG